MTSRAGWMSVVVALIAGCLVESSDRMPTTPPPPTPPPTPTPTPTPTPSPVPPPPTGLALYESGCIDELDCFDLDAVCLEDTTTGGTFCTLACASDLDCPSPGVCAATTAGGYCVVTSSPPPPPLPPPPPPGPLPFYERGCETSGCVTGAECYTLTNTADGSMDSLCTAPCALDTDCGTNGWCVLQFSSSSICFEACATNSDCPLGWMCEQVEDFETKELVPACIPAWL